MHEERLEMPDPTDIFMWRRLDSRITTSGQPNEQQLAAIKALGVTHVVNLGLHTHEKALLDEAASVSALGMVYIHIPVEFDNPTEENFDRFCSAMRNLEGETVHVHCIANLRVSAFFYRYHREQLGLSEQEARATTESVWRPGSIWADFIGDAAAKLLPHRYGRRDY
jgi:protein tyrosine phosphatase (PTP) superfamily phosphohydrolase (DUF442 family)